MYPVKPRPILQRRNTITGTTPTNKRPTTSIEEVSQNLRHIFHILVIDEVFSYLYVYYRIQFILFNIYISHNNIYSMI